MASPGLYKFCPLLFRSCSLLKTFPSTYPKHGYSGTIIISRNDSTTNYSRGDFMNQYNATKARIEEGEFSSF